MVTWGIDSVDFISEVKITQPRTLIYGAIAPLFFNFWRNVLYERVRTRRVCISDHFVVEREASLKEELLDRAE